MATNIDFITRNGLQVMGNVAVGAYATVNAAPTNGMIVSGNVGIGTATIPTGNVLAIKGDTYLWGNVNIVSTGVVGTGIRFSDGTFQTTAASNAAAGDIYDVQLNSGSGSFTASNDFQFDFSTKRLGIGTTSLTNTMTVSGATPAYFQTTNGAGLFEILVGNTATSGATLGYASGTSPAALYLKVTGAADYGVTVVNNGGTSAVGIGGVTSPKNKLDVGGSMVVGGVYAGVVTGPTNGLAVQGRIGIGTSSPLSALDVRGGIGVTGDSNFGGVLTVNSLVSNAGVSLASLTVSGAFTANSINSNTSVVATNIQSTGQLTAASIVSNANITGATLNTSGTAQFGNVISNGYVFTQTLNSAGAATVNSLNSNTNVVATNIQSTGQATFGLAVVNTNITTSTLNATSSALVNSLNSNTNVVATNIQSTGQLTAANIVSNTNITSQTINTSGAAVFNSVTSNTTIQSAGAATFNAVTSNTSIAAASATITNNLYSGTLNVNGALQAGSVASNAGVSGTTGTFSGALYSGSFNTAGTATVNALVSNTNVKTATVNASSTIVGANIYSNGFVQAAGTVTGQAISSNTTVTAGTGLTVTSGGITATGNSQFTGNVNVSGNLNVSGAINAVSSNILVVQDPLIFVGANNPGDTYDLGIVGSYTEGSYFHTGLARNATDNTWTLFDTLITAPNASTGSINWSDASLTFGPLKVGNLTVAGQTPSTSTTTGAIVLSGTGGMGIGGRLNVGGSAWFAGTVNAGGTAIVNALVSNGAVSGTTGTFGTSLQSGAATVQSLNSNTNVVGVNLQSTGQATVASLVSNGAISGTTINGTAGTFTSLQVSGTTTTNALVSNVYGLFGQNVTINSGNVSSTTTTGALVVTGGVGIGGRLNVGGNSYYAGILNTGSALIAQSINSNTNVVGVNIQSTGQLTAASIVSNANIFGATLNTSGQATLASAVVNANITTATLNSTGAAIVNTLTSNSTANFNGTVLINSTTPNTGPGTGALQIAGGASIAGNLTVTGNITGSGNVTVFTGNSGVFYGDSFGFGALQAGITGFTPLPQTVTQFSANYNGYAQINFENINGGNAATTDFIATANNGTDTTFYVDLGIAGSGYDNTAPNNSLGTALFPNDSYLYAQGNLATTGGGNLVIGTNTPTKGISFITGGHDAANVAVNMSEFGVSVLLTEASTNTNNGALTVDGGVGIDGNINVGGTRSTFTNRVGIGTSSAVGMSNVLSVYGTAMVYGNIDLANPAGGTSGIYFNDGSYQTTAAVSTPSFGATGTIQFAGAGNTFSGDTANFFWDDTNNRLGLGTQTPLSTLDVNGVASFRSAVSAAGTVTVNSLVSNTNVVGTNLQSTGAATVASLNSNTNVVATNLQATGQATVASLVSNTSVAGQQFQLNGNVATTSGITSITVDSFLTAAYRTAHYIVQVTDNTASSYHSAQIMLIHDGTTVYKTEYNEIYTAGLLGNFDATITGGVLTLTFQANAATNKTIKMVRTMVAV